MGGTVTMVVLSACYGVGYDDKYPDSGATIYPTDTGPVDADQDGVPVGRDCDDNNAAVNPGVPEDCGNAIDDDCDERIDAADPDCQTGTPGGTGTYVP